MGFPLHTQLGQVGSCIPYPEQYIKLYSPNKWQQLQKRKHKEESSKQYT